LSLGPHYSVAARFFDIFQLHICSLLLFPMAANPVPSFADLLAADSDFVMPTTDAEVKDALDSFGASFKKTRGDANVAARADLLAGLALLHTHHGNLGPLLAALPAAQQQILADALELDFEAFGADASWPTLLSRRVIAWKAPGLTPQKRRGRGR
jgi:hypothetical protein